MRANTTLKIDWDDRTCPQSHRFARLLARAGYRLVGCAVRRSPSGRGWHVWLVTTPKPKSLQEVVALQAMCGSDPWREAMTLFRANHATTPKMREMANVLYTPCKERRRRVKHGAKKT